MRNNGPVTGREIELKPGQVLLSQTDLKGIIVEGNADFVELSGYTRDELIGAPHNLIRHPDMPEAAFKDLWDTVKKGMPWTGVVKNRAKSGDHYWVVATVSPVRRNGEVVGYVSARVRPTEAEKAAATRLYADMNAGRVQGAELRAGYMRPTGLAAKFDAKLAGTLARRMNALIALFLTLLLSLGAAGLWLGYAGYMGTREVVDRGMQPILLVADITDRMRNNIQLLSDGALALHRGEPQRIPAVGESMRANIAAITRAWGEFTATLETDADRRLAAEYAEHRGRFVREGLLATLAELEKGQVAEAERILLSRTSPLFETAFGKAKEIYAARQEKVAALAEDAKRLLITLAGTIGALFVAAAAVGWFAVTRLRRAIDQPLGVANRIFEALGEGEYETRIAVDRDDEMGGLLRQLSVLQCRLAYQRHEMTQSAKISAAERMRTLEELGTNFEATVSAVVRSVSDNAAKLKDAVAGMRRSAGAATEKSTSVAAATAQATASVQAVASAAEQLSASISEISSRISDSSRIVESAVSNASEAKDKVQSLTEASQKVGAIVKLIANIAAQTSLLALNATIEAARAGDAGKGFAVVASEVKALSTQTAKATEEIGQQISAMQEIVGASASTILEVVGSIEKVSQVSGAIAAAVEEQGAATKEIARNVTQAATGTEAVSRDISEVSSAASTVYGTAAELMDSAIALTQSSDALGEKVSGFLVQIKAA